MSGALIDEVEAVPSAPPTHTVRVKSMGMGLACATSQAIAVPTGTPVQIAFPGQVRVKGM